MECVCKKTCDGKKCDLSSAKTCIDNDEINKMILKYYKETFNTDKVESQFFKNIDKLIEYFKVDTESCLLLSDGFTTFSERNGLDPDEITKYVEERFLPKGPRDQKNDGSWPWLSNFNIDNVLSRLESCYPEFKNIGYQMIDFKTTGTLYDYDFKSDIAEGKTKFGVVLNTDVSSGKGIHWFCMFIDFSQKDTGNQVSGGKPSKPPCVVEFFNSSGRAPTSQVGEFHKHLINKYGKEFDVDIMINRTAHQKRNSECGVYCLFYIWARLKGISVDLIFNVRIEDAKMEEFRKYIFRKC
jgi:hypothetical protein